MQQSNAPLLIVGAGRSGTTLLVACLNGHPRVEMKNEYCSIATLMGHAYPVSSVSRILEERLAGFRKLCDEDRLRYPEMIWGNKVTTEQIAGLEIHNSVNDLPVNVVQRFVEAMEGYRIIFISRHGASSVESKVRRKGHGVVLAAIKWCYGVRFYETIRSMGPLAAFCRYEDLVSDPRSTLTKLCDSLDLDFDENMLLQTDSPIMGDYRQERFLPEKAVAYQQLAPEVVHMLAPYLERMGYALP